MTTLSGLLAIALLGQNASSSVRVAPETLAWLRKGGSSNLMLAEALVGNPATSQNVAPKEAAFVPQSGPSGKILSESKARAGRQLQGSLVKGAGPTSAISVDRKVATRTILSNGDVLYDFTLSSGLLTPVSLDETELADEKKATTALSRVVLSKLLIPNSAQSPITGSLRRIALANGHWIWGGVIEFGHAPDANGIYHIADPKWYDDVSVWTDGETMFIQYGRDDTVMRSANANPQP